MKTAYIKEVGWKMERMSLSQLHGFLIADKTFMHIGVFLFIYFIINIQPRDKTSVELFFRGKFQN